MSSTQTTLNWPAGTSKSLEGRCGKAIMLEPPLNSHGLQCARYILTNSHVVAHVMASVQLALSWQTLWNKLEDGTVALDSNDCTLSTAPQNERGMD
eukprot:5662252-Amphidinium_carterae.1